MSKIVRKGDSKDWGRLFEDKISEKKNDMEMLVLLVEFYENMNNYFLCNFY